MRNSTSIALALAAAVTGGGLALAVAQPAPPPGVERPDGPPPHPPMGWMQGWRHGPGPERPGTGRRGPVDPRAFALVTTAKDRGLSGADVKTIAEAFLLWHGNHGWKVTEVAETSADTVGFAYATPSGDVIARFTMDRHSGRVSRVS